MITQAINPLLVSFLPHC